MTNYELLIFYPVYEYWSHARFSLYATVVSNGLL